MLRQPVCLRPRSSGPTVATPTHTLQERRSGKSMAAPLYQTQSGQLYHAGKILLVTVGLPARGKTHMSHSLERYLKWIGVKCAVLSLGDYRRKALGGAESVPSDYFKSGPKSEQTIALRKKIQDGLDAQVEKFFLDGGQLVIYDANNGLQSTRYRLRERYGKMGVHVMFLESICDDQAIIETNIRSVKISSPDYVGWHPEKAVADYWTRIKGHEKYYEPIENPSFPYIKVVNVGEQIIVNNIQGYLQSRVAFFLMNIHNKARTIYFARAGKATIEHLYKADADLSPVGKAYAERLKDFLIEHRKTAAKKAGDELDSSVPEVRRLTVWTSTRRRSHNSALPFRSAGYRVIQRSQLSEINPGVVDGMSEEAIKARYPDEWARKLQEPYSHRYPRAESYHDLSVRLEPVICEIEREQDDLLIIGHASVLRCLIAYLTGTVPSEIPKVEIQQGELVEIRPGAYQVTKTSYTFWTDADTAAFDEKRVSRTPSGSFHPSDNHDETEELADEAEAKLVMGRELHVDH